MPWPNEAQESPAFPTNCHSVLTRQSSSTRPLPSSFLSMHPAESGSPGVQEPCPHLWAHASQWGHMDGHSNPLTRHTEQRGTCQSIPSGPSLLARPDGCFPPVPSPRVFQESSHPTPSARAWIRLHFAPASLGFWLPRRRDGAGLNLHRWEDKRRGKEVMGAKDPFNHPALRKNRPDRVFHWLLKPDAGSDWPESRKTRPWRKMIGLRAFGGN